MQANLCKCETTTEKRFYAFEFSHKLRPPTKKNNVKWRTFLDDCPQFINCLPAYLFDDFNTFLKSIGFKKDSLNGRKIPLTDNGDGGAVRSPLSGR